MNLDRYTLERNENSKIFEFTSTGPKGAIQKIIKFQKIDEAGLHNLAFGNSRNGGFHLDDLAVSNNGDTDKVLATVVSALYSFFDTYPAARVYAKGSTPVRTRLYRMGITRFYSEMVEDFELYGRKNDVFYPFRINEDYEAFLVQRKLS